MFITAVGSDGSGFMQLLRMDLSVGLMTCCERRGKLRCSIVDPIGWGQGDVIVGPSAYEERAPTELRLHKLRKAKRSSATQGSTAVICSCPRTNLAR